MTKLSEHFTLEELVASQYAARKGINNAPSAIIISNLTQLSNGLEKVRALLNAPILVSSGYRCTQLNIAVGGSSKSDHVLGYAADFTCPKFGTPKDIVKAIIASNIQFSQIIYEGMWVHLSFAPNMKREALTATFKNGKASYSPFKE